MKKSVFFCTFIIFLQFFLGNLAHAQPSDKLNVYFFHSESCPHCKDEAPFLAKLQTENPGINVVAYEITTLRDNYELFGMVGEKLNVNVSGVPFTLIGEKYISGYLNEETTGKEIRTTIENALKTPQRDVVAEILKEIQDNQTKKESAKSNARPANQINAPDMVFKLPLIGKVNTKNLSLPAITFVIGFLDGFNPCAMWVLLFLISMLLGMENRKKMWLIGSTFIFASGFVYFLFMSAWLNFFLFLGYSVTVRYLIGLFAVVVGGYYLYDYWLNKRPGCSTAENEKRLKVFEKIKNIINKKNIIFALVGVALLAFAVNIVELLCSAGLPAIYTGILTSAKLPIWQYYAYILLYILFFMIDDIVVFVIAMITLKSVGIETKYGRYSHLLGGIIMFLIGLSMLFKPELLVFK